MKARLAGIGLIAMLLLAPFPAGAASNDTLIGKQWGLAKIQAENAWTLTKGAGVKIAIVDTGVHLGHPDLAANLIAGRDFVNNDSDPQDDDGHGTHVAGIAAAVSGNSIGVAGVAPSTKILPVKVLDPDGGFADDISDGIRYATDRKAGVINLSLGEVVPLTELRSQTIDDAIKYAVSKGVVVVAAAGNDAYPFASRDTADLILMVGATTRADGRAAYSNSGDGVRLWAPGGDVSDVLFCEADENIWSTILPASGADCKGDGYDTLSGTSMAAPHAAGAAALVRATNPSLSNSQVIDVLINNADTISGGLKRLNAFKAVSAAKAAASLAPVQGPGGSTSPAPPRSSTGAGGSSTPASKGSPQATAVPAEPTAESPSGLEESAEGKGGQDGSSKRSAGRWPLLIGLMALLLALLGSAAVIWIRRRASSH